MTKKMLTISDLDGPQNLVRNKVFYDCYGTKNEELLFNRNLVTLRSDKMPERFDGKVQEKV